MSRLRAVFYLRVSSARQREKHTIESQERVLPAFAATHPEWKVVSPVHHYVDDGRTAKAGHLDAREAFSRLLADARAGRFDVVIVIDIDRLTRSEDLGERGEILGTFQKAGVRIAIANTGQVLDLSSSMGDLFAGLQTFFAAEENRKRRARTIEGKLTAIGRGRKPSGPTPFGLCYDRVTGKWSIDPDDGPIVRELFERVAKLESCYRLALMLEERAVPRPRGGAWQRERVCKIVTNPAYRGEWVADKAKKLKIKVPAIVSEELWQAAQDGLARRRSYPMPKAQYFSLGEGICFCELCGEKMLITGNKKRRRYFVCRSKKVPKSAGLPRCPNRMHFVPDVDERIWSAVNRVLERPDLLAEAVDARRARTRGTQTDWAAQLEEYEGRLEKLERAEAAIIERFRRGRISEAAFDRHLDGSKHERGLLERNRDLARQQLTLATRSKAELETLMATASSIRQRIERASQKERRDLVRLLVPGAHGYQVTIGRERIEVAGLLRSEPVFRTSAAG